MKIYIDCRDITFTELQHRNPKVSKNLINESKKFDSDIVCQPIVYLNGIGFNKTKGYP
jgi:hypothetical protein